MKFHETGGKNLITWIVFGVVGLLILGALSSGPGAWTYYLGQVNQTYCPQSAPNCNTTYAQQSAGSSIVGLVAGTILVILFFIAVTLKFL